MSLIDEALKRVQAAHGSTAPAAGRPHAPLPLPDSGRTRRRRTLRNAGLVLIPAVAAVVLAILLVRNKGGPPSPEESSVASPLSEPTPRSVSPTVARDLPAIASEVLVPPPEVLPEDAPSLRVPFDEAGPPAAAPTPAAPPEMAPVARAPAAIEDIEPIVPMIASGSPMIVRSERPRSRPTRQDRTFVREAVLSSGERISLDGIVYSEENPTALLNGRVVSVGSFVEGLEVVRIRADRVELQDDATAIVILLK